MDGETEERPGQAEALAAAHRSVEKARGNLDEEQRKAARRELGGWLIKMRENKWMRGPMKRLTALFLGVPLSASAAELETPSAPASEPQEFVAMIDAEAPNPAPERAEEATEDESVLALNRLVQELVAEHPNKLSEIERKAMFEAQYPETDRFYLYELSEIGKTIEGGLAAPEYYARVGRPEWTPYQRSLFADAPVQERFTELHPEYRNLSAQEFLSLYPEMLSTAKREFRFSNEYRYLTDQAIDLLVAEAPTMDPEEAARQYQTLVFTVGQQVGLAHVARMTDLLAEALPSDHPVMRTAQSSGVIEAMSLVGPSKKNIVHMDQVGGELRVIRKLDHAYLLIDSFPAIGGPLNSPEMSVAGKASGSEFVHVPDTAMKVAYVDRAKTSWSWHSSWIPQGAPIREAGDELQYQHPATRQWYDLTGPNSGFFPDKDGHVLKPFDKKFEPMDAGLIRAATHRSPDGSMVYVPKAWTKEDVLKRNGGEVPTEWKWNDFGSMAIRLNTGDGQRTNINIHSKPNENPDDFLPGRTHGCLSTFSENVKALADTYGVGGGSTVVATTEYAYKLNELLE